MFLKRLDHDHHNADKHDYVLKILRLKDFILINEGTRKIYQVQRRIQRYKYADIYMYTYYI
jgi:hypothetical protein